MIIFIIMELYGMIFFSVAYVFGLYQLAAEKKALDIDRRSLWKKGESLLKLERELESQPKGFDWTSNLPMILGFLKNKPNLDLENIDQEEIQNIISQFNGGK